jgi:hypothetical protein
VTKRNPILVVALTFVTFTVYAYYWLYKTTDELKDESGRDDLSPVLDVVLAVLTLGLWGLWAAYRNARITHELFEELGEKHTDRSVAVALFGAASFFSGWAWLVSMALLQDDYNRLAEDPADRIVPARSVRGRRDEAKRPVEARVDVEPSRSSDDEASSAPVFVSKAPAPIVF